MKNVIVCLGVLTVFFISCTKDDQPDIGAAAGTWQWVNTEGGIGGHIQETPASTGNQIELTLNSDHTYTEHTNGSVTGQGNFRLEKRKCIHDGQDKPMLILGPDQSMMIERPAADTLVLSDEFADGAQIVYSRKN